MDQRYSDHRHIDQRNTNSSETEHRDEPDCDLCGPAIELTRGGRLTLRHSRHDDVEALDEMYRKLRPNDLRRRFFTAGPPSRLFLERWTSLHGPTGFGLVAELSGQDGAELIGEAGYGRCGTAGGEGASSPGSQAGGGTAGVEEADFELGITVVPGSRGWLGPWLLDRLLAHAAAQGIATLQAVVLTDNRTMLALAAKRGYAILGHPDRGLIRLTMATTGSVPSWPGPGDKPRVLIETDRTRWIGEEALIAAGFDIAICAETCRGGHTCPVLEGHNCPLIDDADVVIVDIGDTEAAEQLLRHEQIVHPGVQQLIAEHPALDDGTDRTGPVDVDALVDRVRDLLDP